MGSFTNLALAAWDAALNAALALLNGGSLLFYSGTQPATPDVAITTQTLIASCALNATAFQNALYGTAVANAITPGSVGASGTITWFRAVTSGSAAVIDGSVGLSGSDINLSQVAVVGGLNTIDVTTWNVSCPVSQ